MLLHYNHRKCHETPSKVPCCVSADGKPGKTNPETNECEEECDCDPKDPTKPKGVKVTRRKGHLFITHLWTSIINIYLKTKISAL